MLNNVSKSRKSKASIQNIVLIGVLSAIVILMSFTPIGFIPIGPGFNISILTIPVAIAAINIGPGAGAILGLVFGSTSFIVALLGTDPFGTLIFSLSPLRTLLACIIPRVLMGLLCGVIFKAIKKIDKTNIVSYAIGSVSAAILNTVFFLSSIWLLFIKFPAFSSNFPTGSTNNIISFIIALGAINAVIEAIAALIIGTTLTKAIASFQKRLNKD